MIQKQMIQNEAEKLKIKERLAKAKARIQACNNIELESGNEREQSLRMDDASRVTKIEMELEWWAVTVNKEQNAHYRNNWDLQGKVDRVRLPRETVKEDLEHRRDQKNITEIMSEVLRQKAAPELEIDIFDSNPTDFHYLLLLFFILVR